MNKEELLGVIVSSMTRETLVIKDILLPHYIGERNLAEIEKLTERFSLILRAKDEIEQLLGNWTISTPDLVQFSDEDK